MLLAVEGGGFFSASASGYRKGLTLLLLGQKNEEKPMRVTPWNQYQLVDQDLDPDLQLASRKNQLIGGCTSSVCFGGVAAGLENPSPLPGPPVSDKVEDHIQSSEVGGDNGVAIKFSLRSSLKKPVDAISLSGGVHGEHEELFEKVSYFPGQTERRKVQWTDTSGGELVEIWEFEPSDVDGSDDELDNGSGRACLCRIM